MLLTSKLIIETDTLDFMSINPTQLFEDVISEFRQSLARIVATYEMKPELQQELHQEILLAIWKSLPNFRGESGLHTFVYRVAHNQAMNHVSRYSRIPVHESISEGINENIKSDDDCPEISAIKSQKMHQMFKAMHQLSIIQRQIITLALEGLSYQEISEVTGLNINNIGVKLNRAKSALKIALNLAISNSNQGEQVHVR